MDNIDWNNYSPTRARILRIIIFYNLPVMLAIYVLSKFGVKPRTNTDKQLFVFLTIVSICSTLLYVILKDFFLQ